MGFIPHDYKNEDLARLAYDLITYITPGGGSSGAQPNSDVSLIAFSGAGMVADYLTWRTVNPAYKELSSVNVINPDGVPTFLVRLLTS